MAEQNKLIYEQGYGNNSPGLNNNYYASVNVQCGGGGVCWGRYIKSPYFRVEVIQSKLSIFVGMKAVTQMEMLLFIFAFACICSKSCLAAPKFGCTCMSD